MLYSTFISHHSFSFIVTLRFFKSALFARWLTYAHEEKAFRKMYSLTGKQNRLKILLRCFLKIRTRFPDKKVVEWKKHEKDCFPIVRVTADLHQMSKRFFAVVRKSLYFRVKKCNAEYLKNIKKESKYGISFRLFKIHFKYETNKRLTEEQRILSQSFCTRGEKTTYLSHLNASPNTFNKSA